MQSIKMRSKPIRVDRSANAIVAKVENLKHEQQIGIPLLEISYIYYNHLPYPVYILDRGGIVACLPTVIYSRAGSDGITILKKYRFTKEVIFDLNNLLTAGIPEADHKAFMEAYNSRWQDGHSLFLEFSVRYVIQSNELADGACYVKNLDVIACLEKPGNVVHPAFAQHRLMDITTGSYINYVLSDPNREYECLYLSLNGKVMSINSDHNSNLEEGLWIYSSNGEDNDCARYDINKALEENVLFGSYQEAMEYGSIESRLEKDLEFKKDQSKLALLVEEQKVKELSLTEKAVTTTAKIEQEKRDSVKSDSESKIALEIANMKHEQTLREQQFAQAKQEADHRARVLEQELKAQALRQELELKRIQQSYEFRSLDRKDSSEMVKWLPGLLLGGLAVYKVFG